MKGYKVTDIERKKKYGIAANSLSELLKKAKTKLQVSNECRLYLAKDGTLVDDEDYFSTLEAQTLFVLATGNERIETDFQLIFKEIKSHHSDLLHVSQLVKQFVGNNRPEIDKLLALEENSNVKKTACSFKHEHMEWFQGKDANLESKEEVMTRRAQDRIRGYFYKTKDELTSSDLYQKNKSGHRIIDDVLEYLQLLLTTVDYYGALFNRKYKERHPLIVNSALNDEVDSFRATKKIKTELQSKLSMFPEISKFNLSLCTKDGVFLCHGQWNQKCCAYQSHLINPYSSREKLILFQVWNLDHQIEISRSVLPSMMFNIRRLCEENSVLCPKHKRPAKMISIVRYFSELFSITNLKLVHIVCHDKAEHSLTSKGNFICDKCAEYQLLLKLKSTISK